MTLRLVALVTLLALSGSVVISARKEKGINDDMNRIGEHPGCSRESLNINQGAVSGTKSYEVEIVNVCTTGCSVSNIKVDCGSFSSSTFIDPKVFRGISNNLCLVNDGGVLRSGESVSFSYANVSPYPLSVSSVDCS